MELNFGKDVIKSKLYGISDYGRDFDDVNEWQSNNLLLPNRISIKSGVIIDHVALGFDKMNLPHGGSGGIPELFSLGQGEYIIQVDGNFKSFNGSFVLNHLMFKTNKGMGYSRTGYNGAGVEPFSFKVEDGFAICCLYGKALDFIGSIGFYAVKVSAITPEMPEMSIPDMPKMADIPKMSGGGNPFGKMS